KRSSAWMPAFSSTHSTTARSGGSWYRPTTSTTFSTNSGSADSLNVPAKCGLMPNLRQIRPIVDLDSPLRHRGPRPVRGVLRHLLQRGGDDLLHLVQQDRRRPARPRLI